MLFFRIFYSMILIFALPCGTIFFFTHSRDAQIAWSIALQHDIKICQKSLILINSSPLAFWWAIVNGVWSNPKILKISKKIFFFKNQKFWPFSLPIGAHAVWSKFIKMKKSRQNLLTQNWPIFAIFMGYRLSSNF